MKHLALRLTVVAAFVIVILMAAPAFASIYPCGHVTVMNTNLTNGVVCYCETPCDPVGVGTGVGDDSTARVVICLIGA
jgi:hypothetical protein